MQDVRHQCLESHILHACNVLSALEILRGPIKSTLSSVVHQVLQNAISYQLRVRQSKTMGAVGSLGDTWGSGVKGSE